MQGDGAIGRAQLPGSFKGDRRAHGVPEKTEWRSQRGRQCTPQPLHQRAHRREWWLVKTRRAARQLHGTEIHFRRHKVPQRPVKRGIAASVGKAEKAATHDWAFIAKRYPLIERHASIVLSEQRDRQVPDQKIMRKTLGSKVLVPDID